MVKEYFFIILSNLGRFVIPFLFIPLASRGLNTTDFTSLTLTLSFATWAALIVEFGFNFSAGNKIKYTSGTRRIHFVAWNVLVAKIILSAVSVFIGIYCSLFLFSSVSLSYLFLFWLYCFSVGGISSFVFVATRRSSMLMIGEGAGVALFLMMIAVIWLLDLQDKLYAFLLALTGYRLAIFAFFSYVSGVFKAKLKRWVFGWHELKTSLGYGLYQISSSLYLYGISIVASFVIDKRIIVYHVLAERVYRIVTFSFTPLSRLIFTRINNVTDERDKAQVQKKGLIISLAYGFLLTGILYYASPQVISMMFGERYSPASANLWVLALSFPVAFCNGILSSTLFLATRRMQYLNRTIVAAGLSCIPVCYVLADYYPKIAASVTYLFAEMLILVLFCLYWFKNKELK